MSQVILDESRITQMLGNSVIVQKFPFMRSAAAALTRKGCGCRRATNNKARDYTALKTVIAGLPKAKKDLLKELLGATEVVFTYIARNGLKVNVSF